MCCALELLEPPAIRKISPRDPANVVTLGRREVHKFALQNMALLYVWDLHRLGQIQLPPSAVNMVKNALGSSSERAPIVA